MHLHLLTLIHLKLKLVNICFENREKTSLIPHELFYDGTGLINQSSNCIFFWNSTLKEKPCGTILCCNMVAGRPKPVMLNAQAECVIYFKTI